MARNRSDAEWVLAHFAEDALFVSPLAARITGAGEIRGKAALRNYWQRALRARTAPPRFELVEYMGKGDGGGCLIRMT